MTVQTNRRAVYANTQPNNSTTAGQLTQDNLIPISADVAKTVRDGDNVEIPLLRDRFGAPDFVTTAETQAISIPTFPYSGGLANNGAAVEETPLYPLLIGSFHAETEIAKDLTSTASGNETAVYRRFTPVDDPLLSAYILYRFHKFNQEMINAYGTMSFAVEVNQAATMNFDFQSAYRDSVVAAAPSGGTKPVFGTPPVVSRFNSNTSIKGLSTQLGNCITSFSFSQNATISPIDCIGSDGIAPTKYSQTNRAATGEITFLIDETTLAEFNKVIGGKKALSAPVEIKNNKLSALVQVGTTPGNIFVFGSKRFKLGNPTEGEVNGTGSYTCPITFIPEGDTPDYELGWIGDITK